MIMFRIVNIYFFQSFPTLDTVSFFFLDCMAFTNHLNEVENDKVISIINESENKMVLDTLLS